ncbi:MULTISPECIES: tetratricopeptide repeat protein [unclassified Streptomyces]|uniref:tetratricopeptide repeat protein n=1 Tax=unclassified Streptomyces TaxID=2593676 RepID=UPI00081E78E2|nr:MULTISPECIES: tetratricopeptide repeat protein [unclassified Streptomyces]MYZ38652.1 tetratricopeptide repeat protein [Streptomyces sp. SID4917]SCF99662.1 Tetratricopeptide repeat-containing protein [Streptomyces sp. MnatMP-M17]
MTAAGPAPFAAPSLGFRDIEAGRDIIVTVHQQFTAPPPRRPEESWPKRVGTVPPVAECFRERAVAADLDAGGAVVLAGWSGVGKTQLAVGHAERLWADGEVDLLVWITAGSRDAIQLGYLAAAKALNEEAAGDEAVKRFLAWLTETPRRWLIVFDGLSESDDLRDLWPPRHASGRTVVTTRLGDVDAFGEDMHLAFVGGFDDREAVEYLHERQAESPHLAEGAAELASELERFPLLLAHAANYVASRDTTYAEYHRLWSARCEQVATRHSWLADTYMPLRPGFVSHIPAVATCSLLLDLASGLTRPVLDLASLVDGGAIPLAFFGTSAVARHLTASQGRTVDANDVRSALAQAHRLGLATIDAHRMLRLDPWMRRVLLEYIEITVLDERDRTTPNDWISPRPDPPDMGERAAGDALVEAWPDARSDPVGNQVFFAAATVLRGWADEHFWLNGGHPVLIRAGTGLKDAGLLDPAAVYFQYLHGMAQRRLGEDHHETRSIRGHLVTLRSLIARGEVTELEKLLAEQTRTLGPRHRETLATRSKVAFARAATTPGDRSSADELQNVLADQRRVLGRNDQDTLFTRYFLGYLLVMSGDLDGGMRELKKVLKDQRRALGFDHARTLYTRQMLAELRISQDDTSGLDKVLHELIEDQKRVLGRNSEQALSTRHNLAVVRVRRGDTAEAATELEEVLADFARVYGADHRETLAVRRNLAATYSELGDEVGALAELELTMNYANRVFSPDDKDFKTTRDRLDHYRHGAYWQVMDEYEREWGANEYLLSQMKDIISSRYFHNEAGAMAGLWESLLSEHTAPRDAEGTLSIRRIAACWHGLGGNAAGAVAELEQILDGCVEALGSEHLLTRFTRRNLAFWRARAGRT